MQWGYTTTRLLQQGAPCIVHPMQVHSKQVHPGARNVACPSNKDPMCPHLNRELLNVQRAMSKFTEACFNGRLTTLHVRAVRHGAVAWLWLWPYCGTVMALLWHGDGPTGWGVCRRSPPAWWVMQEYARVAACAGLQAEHLASLDNG